ncbi:MAG: MoaD/ThiS family protein [Planctomycetia bacterium]|nr:MoaD/ThiS family protein [Planctomycetia bacterium]
MNVRVRLFAVAKQLAGQDLIILQLPERTTLRQLREKLAAEVPQLAAVLPHILFAVGSEYANDSSLISADSEVACIPPVSGG